MPTIAPRRDSDRAAPEFSRELIAALRHGDAGAAERVVAAARRAGLTPVDVHVDVIAPAMVVIGELWAAAAISVADEHLATAISHGLLSRLYPELLRRPLRSRARVLLAAAQGDNHVLGLRMVADTLEGAGYDVRFLGGDVPVGALVEMADRTGAAVVGLSATVPTAAPELVEAVRRLNGLPQPPLVLVGGAGIPAEVPGAIHVATSRDVLQVVEAHLPKDLVPPAAPDDCEPEPCGGSDVSGVALAASDVARDHARRAHELEALAMSDPLTGLLNRRGLEEHLSGRHGTREDCSLVLLDLDHFKEVNDRYGHPEGDRVLADAAEVVRRHLRQGDLAARIGGDEFALVLAGQAGALDQAVEVAERIRRAMAEVRPGLTVSVGITAAGEPRATFLAVDRALYESKRAGRDRITVA